MKAEQFRKVCIAAFQPYKNEIVPNPKTRGKKWYINAYGNWQRGSTGNMAFNATKMEFPDPNTCIIYIDERIAPYVPYTNEPWISPKWKGHKNPNEHWFDKSAQWLAEQLAKRVGGTLIITGGKQ